MSKEGSRSEEDWRASLTQEEYHLLREKGTEAPFTGKLLGNKRRGTYVCAGCGNPLFSSDAKFDSGSGWPSFFEPISGGSVQERIDKSMSMTRTEVLCEECGGHLGHVFDDGPEPTGQRYCINSGALHFDDGEKNDVEKERK